MEVYVLMSCYEFEGDLLISIHSTMMGAKAAANPINGIWQFDPTDNSIYAKRTNGEVYVIKTIKVEV